MDGVFVANKMVDYATKDKKCCLFFKVNFEKIYDKVSWEFLKYMTRRMRWMGATIFTSHVRVMVNGSLTKEFGVDRGLK